MATGTPRSAPAARQGDAPPNARDNTAWKRRREPQPADAAAAEAAARRIRPTLEAGRARGAVSPQSVLSTLVGLGYAVDGVQVVALRAPLGEAGIAPPPGAAFALRVGATACVVGDVRPEAVRVTVAGTAAEFGCLEPYSH